jgi:hypothetical protein
MSAWKDRHDEAWDNSAPTGQIFMQFDMSIFLKYSYVEKIQV